MPGFAVNGDPPENLLSLAGHEAVNHLAAPFNLLDQLAHQGVDHTIAPFNLITQMIHDGLDHASVPNVNPVQVSSGERTAGSSGLLRSFSPLDVATMAGIHGGALSFSIHTLTWNNDVGAKNTSSFGLTPKFAIAMGAFKLTAADSGRLGTHSIGFATSVGSQVSTATFERYAGSDTDAMKFRVNGTIGGVGGAADNYPDSDTLQESYSTTSGPNGWNLIITTWSSSGITVTPSGGTDTITGSMYLLVAY